MLAGWIVGGLAPFLVPTDPPPSPTTVAWTGPPECPDEASFLADVESHLADAIDAPRSATVAATATVTVDADGRYSVELDIRSASGARTRRVSAPDCEALAEVAALLVAVAIDPGISASTSIEDEPAEIADPDPAPPDPEVPPEPEPANETATAAHTDASPTVDPPDPAGRVTGAVRVGSGVDLGTLPRVAPMLDVQLALRWRALRAEIGFLHRFARTLPIDAEPGSAVALWNTAAVAHLCGAPSIPRVEFPLCAGVEAGRIAGRSRRVDAPAHAGSAWAALRLRAGLVVLPWEHLGFAVDAAAVFPLTRTGFDVGGVGEVYRVKAVAVVLGAGVEVRFP
jgi:hypothetical protein